MPGFITVHSWRMSLQMSSTILALLLFLLTYLANPSGPTSCLTVSTCRLLMLEDIPTKRCHWGKWDVTLHSFQEMCKYVVIWFSVECLYFLMGPKFHRAKKRVVCSTIGCPEVSTVAGMQEPHECLSPKRPIYMSADHHILLMHTCWHFVAYLLLFGEKNIYEVQRGLRVSVKNQGSPS